MGNSSAKYFLKYFNWFMSARHFLQLFVNYYLLPFLAKAGPPKAKQILRLLCRYTFVAFYITFCMAYRKGTSRTTRFSNNSYLSLQKRGIETSK